MKSIALLAIVLLAPSSATTEAKGRLKQPVADTGSSTGNVAPLRLVKGTKLIVTETDDVTSDGEHSHAVITAEHTITQTTKTEIRFDTHNILNSSSDGYFGRRGDEPDQYIPIDDDPLAGEWGEPTDIYVETPVFNGTVRVLYRHDRATGEIKRWVSIDPVELDLKLEDGSRIRVRADYVKSWGLFNGIIGTEEGFALIDFGFVPVWMRFTLERPGRTEEIFQVLTGVQQKPHR